MAKIIIEAAINGNSDKALNPHIAYSPEDIAADAIATCQAGAAAVHFHVRNPETGEWVQDVAILQPGVQADARALQPDSLAHVSVWRRPG